ncbi:AAA family ATPase [Desulfobacterales bacterium HSG17]|nr:AAA family ATPase [Desulfobacterales bacterium HSG17]
MPSLKKLPVGIQAFETIREGEFIYVDKTQHAFRLIDEGMFYFLSRPRRFGKSLLVSTLKCIFQGRKELFDDLWISKNTNWEWQPHPVIMIDFNQIPHNTPENLVKGIEIDLKRTAGENNITLKTQFIETQLQELITGLYKKTKTKVVILIDEYDKAIIDHLGKGDEFMKIAQANRDILKRYFGVLKGGEVSPMLRFMFITGVSKFSRVSLFSELNNLEDISMNRFYAQMLGYTEDELKTVFENHITRFSKETGLSVDKIESKLKRHYDGYRFSQDNATVYNPFSILSSLKCRNFKNFWFETGTPTFLVNLLKQNNYHIPEIEKMTVDEQVFSTYELEDLKPEAILFQTGYVTIKNVAGEIYCLDYPNREVKISFLKHLIFSYTKEISAQQSSKFLLLAQYLDNENFDDFFNTIISIFASIPYSIESKRDEAYFHTLFYLMVSASGLETQAEIITCRGRIDLAVKFADKVFIMEFKCNQNADIGLAQIREKGYAEPFMETNRKIIIMGINFSTEKRNVAEWKYENL